VVGVSPAENYDFMGFNSIKKMVISLVLQLPWLLWGCWGDFMVYN
jgi:hypothetical protein